MVTRTRSPYQRDLFYLTVAEIAQMSGRSRFETRRLLIAEGLLPPTNGRRKGRVFLPVLRLRSPALYAAIMDSLERRSINARLADPLGRLRLDEHCEGDDGDWVMVTS